MENAKRCLVVLGLIALLMMSTTSYWALRSNGAEIHPELVFERRTVVDDGSHNSNTDLIRWNGAFWMVYVSSPFHMGSSESRLVIERSTDTRDWQMVTSFNLEGKDVRDPKFSIVNGTLFLYTLENEGLVANPYRTLYSNSDDGMRWSEFSTIPGTDGWLFWRPFNGPNDEHFVPAYWHEHGRSALFTSTNGTHWQFVSTIHEEAGVDETACELRSDASMICTVRVEGVPDTIIGRNSGGTVVAVSEQPYHDWHRTTDDVTRLDGPNLFTIGERTFAIGRYQPEQDGLFHQMGGVLSKKRTSIFLLEDAGLTYISDLPSSGDTSYAGVVVENETIFSCYYTSDVEADYPWLIGMIASSSIEFVELDSASLSAAAESPNSSMKGWPRGEYFLFMTNMVFDVAIIRRLCKRRLLASQDNLVGCSVEDKQR